MRMLVKAITLTVALALIGCGGGGGDGGGNGGGNGGGSGGGGSNPPNSIGAAEIVFPWTSSTATAQTVTVGGTATDPEGVARVLVNGSNATITTTASVPAPGALTKTSLNEDEVTWSSQITLKSGENVLAVSVEDATGNVTADVDTATIRYVEVPTTFTLDAEGTRVVGLSFALTSSGSMQNLVEHNYTTLEQTVFGPLGGSPELSCLRQFEDEFLHLSLLLTGTWELLKYDMTTEQDSLLTEIPPAALDGGMEFEAGSVRQLVCGGTHTSAYVLVNYVALGGSSYVKSRIIEIDLGTLAITTLSESDITVSPRWIPQHIALAADRIVTLQDINPVMPLTSVSLVDGARSDLTPGIQVGGFVLHPELASDLVYVATFQGVDEVNLATQSMRNISAVNASHPLAFSQIRSIGFDAANNRVVVGDSDLDTLIALDITTGERSVLLSRNTGTGAALVAPRAFAISADGSRAYVADDGSNAAERLFEIDLTTGDRRMIGDIKQPFNYGVTGLALDEAGRRVFVSFQQLILEVDLETEEVRTLADIDSTILESIHGLLLDSANNRLLIGDPASDGLFALDLATQTIDVISQQDVMGSGPAFGTIISLAGLAESPVLYVAGQASETVTRVDLETGDRETLNTNCDLGGASTFQDLDQVLYNEEANELLISGNRIYGVDLNSGECVSLPKTIFLLQIQSVSANQLLGVSFGALMQIDRTTGEIVIVSK